MRLLVPPPVVAAVAAVAQRALSSESRPRPVARTAVAGVLTVASATLAGASATRFVKSGTTVEPFHPEESSVLVTAGANAISRNPMYVGMAGLLLAHAAWRGSWAALVPLVGFVAIIDRLQIEAEEAALLERFGGDYDVYRTTTPRWLGVSSGG